MSLLDKIAEKARNTTGKLKGPAIVFSSIVDYVAGTHEEMTAHKEELGKQVGAAASGMRDYQLYGNTTNASILGEGIATILASEYCPSMAVVYTLGVDTTVRSANLLVSMIRRRKEIKKSGVPHTEENLTGIIGTVRAIGYKLTGKLKRDEDDAELEDDDPFDDATSQISTTPAADAEDDDEGPDFGMGEEDDSGNALF